MAFRTDKEENAVEDSRTGLAVRRGDVEVQQAIGSSKSPKKRILARNCLVAEYSIRQVWQADVNLRTTLRLAFQEKKLTFCHALCCCKAKVFPFQTFKITDRGEHNISGKNNLMKVDDSAFVSQVGIHNVMFQVTQLQCQASVNHFELAWTLVEVCLRLIGCSDIADQIERLKCSELLKGSANAHDIRCSDRLIAENIAELGERLELTVFWPSSLAINTAKPASSQADSARISCNSSYLLYCECTHRGVIADIEPANRTGCNTCVIPMCGIHTVDHELHRRLRAECRTKKRPN
ncbi:hypothetical protein L1887_58294 [Cichorium endivia]|nr:hypothetical protein L1887_58294 [Cichorium endivia]